MFCYVIYLVILHFGIIPYNIYEVPYLPILFRGVSMMVLFIAPGVFVVGDLDSHLALSNAPSLISFRSALAPALSASSFNNVPYYLRVRGMNVLPENMTLTNPTAGQKYNQVLSSTLAQEREFSEAGQLATNSLYSALQQQSLLLTLKTLTGHVLILALVVAIVAAFVPLHKTLKVAVAKTRDDMV